jgi:hypothetical protein
VTKRDEGEFTPAINRHDMRQPAFRRLNISAYRVQLNSPGIMNALFCENAAAFCGVNT